MNKKLTVVEFQARSRHASGLRGRLRNYAPAGDMIPFEAYSEQIGQKREKSNTNGGCFSTQPPV